MPPVGNFVHSAPVPGAQTLDSGWRAAVALGQHDDAAVAILGSADDHLLVFVVKLVVFVVGVLNVVVASRAVGVDLIVEL